MDELVTRIVLAGLAGSIFVYFMVKLLVDTWLEKKYTEAWWKDLATNGQKRARKCKRKLTTCLPS